MSAAATVAPLPVAIPIIGACLLLASARKLPRAVTDSFAIAVALAVVAIDVVLYAAAGHDGRVVQWVGGWTPVHGKSVGIVLVIDQFGAGAALLAAVLTALALTFSWQHLQGDEGHFHALMLLFLAGMSGFTLTGDVFDMFVFFELMGAAAYALTGFKVGDPTSIQGGLNFGIINSLGAYFTLMGVAVTYGRTGQLGLAQIGVALGGRPRDVLVVVAFVLIMTGWLVKAALVPFHFWLADAHAVAPTPVCVLFSGVMVELGLYGAFRLYWTAFSPVIPAEDVRRAILVLGVITAIVGAIMCLAERHLKRLLAYSTIAHVGVFAAAASSMDAPGVTGSATYVLAHAGAKSALFVLAGVVLNRYRTVDEITLHGRGRELRFVGGLFAVAALALAGLPPFGTALAKSIGEDALAKQGYWIAPVLFSVVSALTAGAVLRAGARIFLGLGPVPHDPDEEESTGDEEHPETDDVTEGRIPVTMLLPAGVLLMGCLAVGVIPQITRSLGRGAVRFLDTAAYAGQALHARPGRSVAPPPEISWTVSGVWLSVAVTAAALLVAAAGLYAPLCYERMGWVLHVGRPAFDVVRRLHSGHVGDYVAFLFVGVAALAALVGLPLLS